MGMRITWLVVLAAGCGGAAESPSTPVPVPPPAPEPVSDILDQGTFVVGEAPNFYSKETFTIRRSGDHRILRANSVGLEDPKNNFVDGELEVDSAWRPVRAAYRKVTPADGFEFRLGGSPLTLDITRDDERHPEHVVATGRIDIYAAGPGIAAMTALCAVDRDVVLSTLGVRKHGWVHHIEAYRGAPVGKLQRIVVDVDDYDLELVCDGERLVAGAMAGRGGFAREGREADLAALRAAPRPPAKAWTHPIDETEPWDPLFTSFVDGTTLVTHDVRHSITRITAFDIATHAELARRDFRVPAGSKVACLAMPPSRFVCMNDRSGYFQIVDARTLVDKTDLAPLFRKAAPEGAPLRWYDVDVKGERVTVPIDDTRMVTIDVAAGTSSSGPKSRDPSSREATICDSSYDSAKVGNATWKIDLVDGKQDLLRTVGKRQLPPIALPFSHPSFMKCAPKGGGVYVMSYNSEHSDIGALRPDASVAWRLELGVHPQTLRVLGGTLLLTSSDQARRVLAIDAATGKLLWEVAGPQSRP